MRNPHFHEPKLGPTAGTAIALVGVLFLLCEPRVQGQCISTVAPPVIWEIDARTGQAGWAGVFNPRVERFPPYTFGNVTPAQGAFTAQRTSGTWMANWDYNGIGEPSFGSAWLRFSGCSFEYLETIGANWRGQFRIEDAYSNVLVRAWIRGGPGTKFLYEIVHDGDFTAQRLNYGGSLRAGERGIGFSTATESRIDLGFRGAGSGITTVTTRSFIEYPGVTYTLAQLYPTQAEDRIELLASAAQSCVLLCPGSFVDGQGWLEASIRIALPGGVPPKAEPLEIAPGFRMGSYVQVPAGIPITVTCNGFDPDDGTSPGSGIVSYRWRLNGTDLPDCGTPSLSVTLPPCASWNLSVSVLDNEGLTDTATVTLATGQVWNVTARGSHSGGGVIPTLFGAGCSPGADLFLYVDHAPALSPAILVAGTRAIDLPFLGGIMHPNPDVIIPLATSAAGNVAFPFQWPFGPPLVVQVWLTDAKQPAVVMSTNGVTSL